MEHKAKLSIWTEKDEENFNAEKEFKRKYYKCVRKVESLAEKNGISQIKNTLYFLESMEANKLPKWADGIDQPNLILAFKEGISNYEIELKRRAKEKGYKI